MEGLGLACAIYYGIGSESLSFPANEIYRSRLMLANFGKVTIAYLMGTY